MARRVSTSMHTWDKLSYKQSCKRQLLMHFCTNVAVRFAGNRKAGGDHILVSSGRGVLIQAFVSMAARVQDSKQGLRPDLIFPATLSSGAAPWSCPTLARSRCAWSPPGRSCTCSHVAGSFMEEWLHQECFLLPSRIAPHVQPHGGSIPILEPLVRPGRVTNQEVKASERMLRTLMGELDSRIKPSKRRKKTNQAARRYQSWELWIAYLKVSSRQRLNSSQQSKRFARQEIM